MKTLQFKEKKQERDLTKFAIQVKELKEKDEMNLVLINQLKDTQSGLKSEIEMKTSQVNEAFETGKQAEIENSKAISKISILE